MDSNQMEAFEQVWPEISKHGNERGWRGVAMAAWEAAISYKSGNPFGYVARANDGHETYFKTEPVGFKSEKWRGLMEVIALYTSPPPQPNSERDAARYRWLRNQDPCEQIGSFSPYAIQGQTGKYLDGTELDSAIDAAIAAQQGEKGGAK